METINDRNSLSRKPALLLAAFMFLAGCDTKEDDLTRRAEQGDAEAQYVLGSRPLFGISPDFSTREKNKLKWLRSAAEQGHVKAQYALAERAVGVSLIRGGFTVTHQEAMMWLRRAAEGGHVEAQFTLGNKYARGQDVTQDHQKAAKWYALAADKGHAKAQFILGNKYSKGEGVPQDHQQAAKWYRAAAEYSRLSGESRTNEIAFKIAANRSAAALGTMYETGQGVPYNPREALKWTRKAATQGHAPAQFTLGNKYSRGQDVTQDHQQAARWYAFAAEQGHAGAHFALGVMYHNGKGVPQDFVKSYAWMNLAAGQGDKKAIERRDSLAEQMTAEQVAEAQKLASELYKRIQRPEPDILGLQVLP